MWTLLVIVLLYVLGIGFFHLVGGIASASDALRGWGEAAATARKAASSPRS